MKDGRCPMCGSQEVYTNSSDIFRAGTEIVKFFMTSYVPYMCASCGYTAMYVKRMDRMADILAQPGWERVS